MSDNDATSRVLPDWTTAGATVLTAAAYLTGYLQIAFFSSALGITARDLGFDFRDYVMLAVVNAAVVALAAGFYWLHFELEPGGVLHTRLVAPATKKWRRRTSGLIARAVRWASIAVVLWTGYLIGVGVSFLAVLVAGIPLIALELMVNRERDARLAVGAVVVAFVAFIAVTCVGADRYARQLKSHASEGDAVLPPVPLRAVVQPEVGVARNGDGEVACVIRISPGVVMGRRAVVVTRLTAFTIRRCPVLDIPFE